jgi:hypothetical protein
MHVDRHSAVPPTDRALNLYHAARHAANLAFMAWLHPDTTDVSDEVDAAHAVLVELARLARSGAP